MSISGSLDLRVQPISGIGAQSYTLTISAGAFALTGEPATLTVSLLTTAGAFVETGEAVVLAVAELASAGAFVETVQASALGAASPSWSSPGCIHRNRTGRNAGRRSAAASASPAETAGEASVLAVALTIAAGRSSRRSSAITQDAGLDRRGLPSSPRQGRRARFRCVARRRWPEPSSRRGRLHLSTQRFRRRREPLSRRANRRSWTSRAAEAASARWVSQIGRLLGPRRRVFCVPRCGTAAAGPRTVGAKGTSSNPSSPPVRCGPRLRRRIGPSAPAARPALHRRREGCRPVPAKLPDASPPSPETRDGVSAAALASIVGAARLRPRTGLHAATASAAVLAGAGLGALRPRLRLAASSAAVVAPAATTLPSGNDRIARCGGWMTSLLLLLLEDEP